MIKTNQTFGEVKENINSYPENYNSKTIVVRDVFPFEKDGRKGLMTAWVKAQLVFADVGNVNKELTDCIEPVIWKTKEIVKEISFEEEE